MASSTVLRADSPPFYPRSVEPIMAGGIPQLTLDTHAAICGMSDEAIADLYPPSDEEISEMEVVDQWVRFLAFIDRIQEREELNRAGFKSFGKRFEARRKEGVPDVRRNHRGKAVFNLPPATFAHDVKVNKNNKDLVKFDPSLTKMRRRDYRAVGNSNKKHSKSAPSRYNGHAKIRPIHQPSKQ